MTVECPLCGKEVSSVKYLGQHVLKKDDDLHNGVDPDKVVSEGSNPENVVDEWRENSESDSMNENNQSDSMQINQVQTADEPADSPDYMPLDEVEVEGLTDEQVNLLVKAKKAGKTEIEDNDKPIEQRDVR